MCKVFQQWISPPCHGHVGAVGVQVTLDFGSPDLRDLGRLVTNVYYHFRDFTTLFRVKNSGFLETFAGKIQVLEKKYILHAPFVFSSVQFSFNNQTESISFSKDLSGL